MSTAKGGALAVLRAIGLGALAVLGILALALLHCLRAVCHVGASAIGGGGSGN